MAQSTVTGHLARRPSSGRLNRPADRRCERSEIELDSLGQGHLRVILSADGTIEFQYRDCSLTDAIAGVSAVGLASTLSEVDLTHGFVRGSDALFEEFTGTGGDTFDIGVSSSYRNHVVFTPSSSTAYVMTVDLQ